MTATSQPPVWLVRHRAPHLMGAEGGGRGGAGRGGARAGPHLFDHQVLGHLQNAALGHLIHEVMHHLRQEVGVSTGGGG